MLFELPPKKFKLLLVDDEPLNILLFSKMLESFSFELYTAENGLICVEKAREIQPDLILLDWNLPVMDGLEALEIIKKDEKTQDIPVIMITGVMSSPENLALAMSIGASDFLKKPFEKLELCARVKNILLLSSSMQAIKNQNQILEDKNVFISALIESIPHPVSYNSLEGTLLLCNKALADTVEIPAKDLINQLIYNLYLKNEIGLHVQKEADATYSGTTQTYEAHVFKESTTYVVSKNVVLDNNQQPSGIISVYTDISKLKQASDELLNTKNVELSANAMHLVQVNEMNEAIINDLTKILPYTSKEGKEIISNISRKFKYDTTNTRMNEFEKHFENAFDSFFDILLQKYPALSLTERKLCGFLRLGLSSKEIASLTFQNPQSVDVARYRLRKKLNLSNEENLVDFLLKVNAENN